MQGAANSTGCACIGHKGVITLPKRIPCQIAIMAWCGDLNDSSIVLAHTQTFKPPSCRPQLAEVCTGLDGEHWWEWETFSDSYLCWKVNWWTAKVVMWQHNNCWSQDSLRIWCIIGTLIFGLRIPRPDGGWESWVPFRLIRHPSPSTQPFLITHKATHFSFLLGTL